jgi:hypothetical protein
MNLILLVILQMIMAQFSANKYHGEVSEESGPTIRVVAGGMLINGVMVNQTWSVGQLDRVLGANGRWIIPTEQQRADALKRFGRPLTTDTYIYDALGINVFVDHQSKAVKSLAIRFGGHAYNNSPVSSFSGSMTVKDIIVSRNSTPNSLGTLPLERTNLPISRDLKVGPFKYSFIFDDATQSGKLSEISISAVN